MKESVENGKPGSQCTCPQDYGKCEGKGKLKIGSRVEDAAYVHYYCNAESQCILGIEKKDAVPQNFLDTISTGFFKASSVMKYNKPFDVAADNVELVITLDDVGKGLVLPVELTKVKLLFSSQYSRTDLLIAEKSLNGVLNGIGDEEIISIPLNLGYKPQELEEAGSIRYFIDFTYAKQDESVRGTFNAPAKPVLFVKSGQD